VQQIKFKTTSVILLGDTHSLDVTYYIVKDTPNLDNKEIIQLGDFGLLGKYYNLINGLYHINQVCKNRNIKLYIIRGNHDFKYFFDDSYLFSNLFFLPDYSFGLFPNGISCLFVGGGISLDRNHRCDGIDHCAQEATEYKKIDKKYNILFSHDTSDYFNNSTESLWSSPYQRYILEDLDLLQDCYNQRAVMGKIIEDIGCDFTASGHFHRSVIEKKNGIIYKGLDINELWMFDSDNYRLL